MQQHKQQPAFFEQLRLADESADDDLALLFERNKDTGRNISQRGITRPDLSGNGQLNCRNSTTSFTPRKPWWIGQLSPNTINCIFFLRLRIAYYFLLNAAIIALKLSSPASMFSIMSLANTSGSGKLSRSANDLSFSHVISKLVLSLAIMSS